MFKSKKIGFIAACFVAASLASSSAMAIEVNAFSAADAGNWYDADVRHNGTTSIVSMPGGPLGNGAAKLTTTVGNLPDKAEVGITQDFGTIGNFVSGGSAHYDFYKGLVPGGNIAAAAALKFEVLYGGSSAWFVYEPVYNGGNPATDTWLSADITGTSGNFWFTGENWATKTLSDWVTDFSDIGSLDIVALSVGVGSWNAGQDAYFDNVQFSNEQQSFAYDFEVSVVPLPAAFPLYGAGIVLLGFFGLAQKTRSSWLIRSVISNRSLRQVSPLMG